jgi:signal peptidase II
MNKKTLFSYGFIALIIILFDRFTKSWALGLTYDWVVNQFLSFGLTFNRGINWGLFNSSDATQFWVINGLIACVILAMTIYTWYCFRLNFSILPNILILSGAASNYYDRMMHGGVIDFIVLSAGNWSWPAFNIADAAIVTGVALLVYQQIKNH